MAKPAPYRPSLIATIGPGVLLMGSHPPPGPLLALADVLMLCARERQPLAEHYPGTQIFRAPLNDDRVTFDEASTIASAAKAVYREIGKGRRVLVTCNEGRNRSGVVVAGALMLAYRDWTADRVIEEIRKKRPEVWCLANEAYVHFLRGSFTRARDTVPGQGRPSPNA